MNYYSYPYQQNGLTWVQGENGAKAYLVAPGNTVLLMDSEGDRFFLKTADNSGVPMPLRVFEFHEVTERAKTPKNATAEEKHDYIERDEFDALKHIVEGLNNEHPISKSTTK